MNGGANDGAVENAASILRLHERVIAHLGVAEKVGTAGNEHTSAGGIRNRRRPRIVARGLIVIGQTVDLDQVFRAVGRLDQELQPTGILLLIVDLVTDCVVDVALVMRRGKGQSRRHGVAQLSVDGPFRVESLIVAAGHIDEPVIGERGLVTDVMDQTAGRIAAEQRTLGTPQHLDSIDVEQTSRQCAGRCNVGIVRIGRHGRFLVVAEIVLRHAAQVVDGDGCSELIELHARHLPRNGGHVFHSQRLQGARIDGGE